MLEALLGCRPMMWCSSLEWAAHCEVPMVENTPTCMAETSEYRTVNLAGTAEGLVLRATSEVDDG